VFSLLPADLNAEFRQLVDAFPPDIEEEANFHFQILFTGQTSVDDFIALLKHIKTSSILREQKLFSCIVHNLLDEYRFFHQYPDKELQITSVLFGQLIQHGLLSNTELVVALRCVLDALKSANSKLLTFGILALQQFKSRLHEWPHFVVELGAIMDRIAQLSQTPSLPPTAVISSSKTETLTPPSTSSSSKPVTETVLTSPRPNKPPPSHSGTETLPITTLSTVNGTGNKQQNNNNNNNQGNNNNNQNNGGGNAGNNNSNQGSTGGASSSSSGGTSGGDGKDNGGNGGDGNGNDNEKNKKPQSNTNTTNSTDNTSIEKKKDDQTKTNTDSNTTKKPEVPHDSII
jgi:uncharacterized membrane protein YgcG